MLRKQYLAQAEEESKISQDILSEKRLAEIQEGKQMSREEKESFEAFVRKHYVVEEWQPWWLPINS